VVGARNLSFSIRASYRDMLAQLIPFASKRLKCPVDRLVIADLSATLVRQFLLHLEQDRHCMTTTRNLRLGALHALAKFIGENSPEHLDWCAQIRLMPFKKTTRTYITYLDKPEMDALLAASDRRMPQGRRDYALLLFFTIRERDRCRSCPADQVWPRVLRYPR
jgi:site-specific recombinase XerD